MTEFDLEHLKSLEPEEFAAMVKGARKSELDELMSGEYRKPILDTIFDRMPGLFRPERAGATDAVIRWNITGDGRTDSYDVTIADGSCTSGPAIAPDPKVAITLTGPDFLTVVAGSANPTMMFMTGKLKFKGDMALAASVPGMFELPKD